MLFAVLYRKFHLKANFVMFLFP